MRIAAIILLCLTLSFPIMAEDIGKSALGQATARGNLASSGGTIGTVKGMCLSTLNGAKYYGEVFTISVKMKPGKGSVSMNIIDADFDFIGSIYDARDFAKKYVAKAGYKVDWDKIDIDIHFQETALMCGNSAGAAIATAMLSWALQMPVRNEVVITGAITSNGMLAPVGGVDIKAAGAFKNPKILTIIVPQFYRNVSEVLSLPTSLLAGRRLIAAQDLNQVFRQAIIGYDKETLSSASKLFVTGLGLYDSGKPEEAISKLEEAMALTPEDMTIPVWVNQMEESLPTASEPSKADEQK